MSNSDPTQPQGTIFGGNTLMDILFDDNGKESTDMISSSNGGTAVMSANANNVEAVANVAGTYRGVYNAMQVDSGLYYTSGSFTGQPNENYNAPGFYGLINSMATVLQVIVPSNDNDGIHIVGSLDGQFDLSKQNQMHLVIDSQGVSYLSGSTYVPFVATRDSNNDLIPQPHEPGDLIEINLVYCKVRNITKNSLYLQDYAQSTKYAQAVPGSVPPFVHLVRTRINNSGMLPIIAFVDRVGTALAVIPGYEPIATPTTTQYPYFHSVVNGIETDNGLVYTAGNLSALNQPDSTGYYALRYDVTNNHEFKFFAPTELGPNQMIRINLYAASQATVSPSNTYIMLASDGPAVRIYHMNGSVAIPEPGALISVKRVNHRFAVYSGGILLITTGDNIDVTGDATLMVVGFHGSAMTPPNLEFINPDKPSGGAQD